MTTTKTTTTKTTTKTEAINKHFTAYKVAIDENKSMTLYKLKNYKLSHTIGLSSLTVCIETSSEVIQYLKTLKAAKESNLQSVDLWQAYNKPLQEIALQEYKKVFANLDIKKQFDLTCCGQVKLISPSDEDGITIRKNIFMRPNLKVNKDNKKTIKTALDKHLTALQNALLCDSNAKIKKQVTNLLSLWQYEMAWASIDAEGIKLLKNLGCLAGAKGNRRNQTKTTLLNKVIECVYTRRKRINTSNANNTDVSINN